MCSFRGPDVFILIDENLSSWISSEHALVFVDLFSTEAVGLIEAVGPPAGRDD